MNRYPRDRVDQILEHVSRPSWAESIQAEPKLDREGEPAIQVTVVVRSGETEVFKDGSQLSSLVMSFHDALLAEEIDLWPYVRFVSADEIEAA